LERDLVISSQLVNINKVRQLLDEIFNESGLNRNSFNRVFLGISEAVNNSIVHGNCLDKDKRVFIRVIFADGQLHVEIKDEGVGFIVDEIDNPTENENLKKENGRGIFIMHNIADEVEYYDGGSKVLIKYTLG
jgi:serine/threonine-protein kinase RsbW